MAVHKITVQRIQYKTFEVESDTYYSALALAEDIASEYNGWESADAEYSAVTDEDINNKDAFSD